MVLLKVKYFILGVFFTVVFCVLLNLFLLTRNDDVVIIKEIKDFDKSLSLIDEKISKIEDEECQNSFVDLKNNIKKTYFSKNTTISSFYEAYFSDKVFLDLYKDVEDVCQIKEDNSRYSLALASYAFPSSIKSKYNLKHEIKFKDVNTREEVLKDEYEVGSYSSKILELRVINELLDGLKI